MQRIADDESAIPYNNRVQKAGMLCRDSTFQTFLVATNLSNEEGEDGAANAVCRYCRIESRSELNGNKKAQERFDDLIKVFDEWGNNESF
jgi:hypothetical protein